MRKLRRAFGEDLNLGHTEMGAHRLSSSWRTRRQKKKKKNERKSANFVVKLTPSAGVTRLQTERSSSPMRNYPAGVHTALARTLPSSRFFSR